MRSSQLWLQNAAAHVVQYLSRTLGSAVADLERVEFRIFFYASESKNTKTEVFARCARR